MEHALALSIRGNDGQNRQQVRRRVNVYITREQFIIINFNINIDNYACNNLKFKSPGIIRVGGDWSSAAFYLAAGALDCDVSITGLDLKSEQGDKRILD
ncbi:MAG: hypothetical protein IJM40_03590, partial [Synergistaceae bacterium]|nr:hypothetical protein [Synergistaceae bacterium]